eukprot:1668500-Pleurochrysis_carterae.AAC.1
MKACECERKRECKPVRESTLGMDARAGCGMQAWGMQSCGVRHPRVQHACAPCTICVGAACYD